MVTTLRIDKLLTCILLFGSMAGCATNPVTGRSELAFVGESTEIAIGQQQYRPSQQSQGGLYLADPSLSRYVSEVGARLAAVSDRSLPYEFVVLNESTPNAWALPGGKIAVNRGLLLALNNEAELAAVLGHEIVHSAARHGAQAMQRGTLLQGAILATSIAADDSEYADYIVGAAQLSSQLIHMRYGRDKELESDKFGIEYMVRAGYDPGAAVTLQETFARMSETKDPGWLAGLFSSHPPSLTRLEANRNHVANLESRPDLEIGKERYEQHLAYLLSVSEAYRAFDRSQFLLSEDKPESALKALTRAQEIEPREARFYGAMGDIYRQLEKFEDAYDAYKRALELDNGYYQYYLGRGLNSAQTGELSAAETDLKKSNELLPTATATTALGNLALKNGRPGEAKGYYRTAMQAGGNIGQTAKVSFIKLDLPDNPGAYISVHPRIVNGYLGATLINQSGIDVSDVRVKFTVNLADQSRSKIVSLKSLQRSSALNSGWRMNQSDDLRNVTVKTISASI
ncbi:MAG TPA: peptidase M48 [Gammaproteobacteria bacterium]|nr:peptidase M48 [Gammaproteobacteria bacterium]